MMLGGEHGDEEQADGAAAHAKCLRLRQRMTKSRKAQLRVNEWIVSFLQTQARGKLEVSHATPIEY
jgi:hypothetical protein